MEDVGHKDDISTYEDELFFLGDQYIWKKSGYKDDVSRF